MASILFEIVTPERIVYKETVDSLTLPTKDGEITVLPNHIPLVAVLVPGVVTVRKGGKESFMAVSGGFIEVQPNNRVVVLADTAERAEELTESAIEKARADAEKVFHEKRNLDDESFAAAAAGLERELARLKVARRHRSHSGQTISNTERK